MSKSIARVVFAVLISLGLLAAASPNVQARLGSVLQKTEANNAANTSMFAGNQASQRGSMSGRVRSNAQFYNFDMNSSHDCDSKDPSLDY